MVRHVFLKITDGERSVRGFLTWRISQENFFLNLFAVGLMI